MSEILQMTAQGSVPPERLPPCFVFFRWLSYLVLRCWCGYCARGGETVPAQGGCIVASNHASFLDPPALGCGVWHRHVRFMARETLFKNPLTRWWAGAVGVVPLDRTKGDISAMRKALNLLKGGGVLALFPEGTRTHDGRLRTVKGGVGFLIARSGVPVVPAFVHGSFQALPRGALFIRPRKVHVVYGQPIMPEELQDIMQGEKRYQDVADFVMSRIAALESRSLEPGASA